MTAVLPIELTPDLAPLRVEHEIVIPALPRAMHRLSTEQKLRDALDQMRAAGVEAELILRGTWRSRGGGRGRWGNYSIRSVLDLRIERWTMDERGLHIDGPELTWWPAPHCTPRPEIVVRGVQS